MLSSKRAVLAAVSFSKVTEADWVEPASLDSGVTERDWILPLERMVSTIEQVWDDEARVLTRS